MKSIGLYLRTCKQCGKKFESRSDYAYRIPRRNCRNDFWYFCSHHCIREYEKAKKKKPTEWERECLKMFKKGMRLCDVAREMGISKSKAESIRDKWMDRKEIGA